MRLIRNRWFIVGAVVLLVAVPGAWSMARAPGAEDNAVVARVKKGEFKVMVNTSGELRATKFVRITAPQNAQAAQQWQMKISSLVPEGTLVKEREVGAERDRYANQVKIVQDVMQGFTIKAPSAGMVIYEKEWNGKKRVVGSQIGAWEPTVATLPDLSHMESMTYVNEIDIRKV